MNHYKMSADAKKKSQFRQTAKWKKFRAYMKKKCNGIDFITGKKLIKGFQLHHKDMRMENYKTLNPDRFLCCNKKTHEMIHWLYNYYKDDPSILIRLEILMEQMDICNMDNVDNFTNGGTSHDKENI